MKPFHQFLQAPLLRCRKKRVWTKSLNDNYKPFGVGLSLRSQYPF